MQTCFQYGVCEPDVTVLHPYSICNKCTKHMRIYVYVRVLTVVQSCMHTYMRRAFICTYIHTCVHTSTHIYINIYIYICIYIHIHTHITHQRTYIRTCTHTYIHTSIHTYIHTFIHTHIYNRYILYIRTYELHIHTKIHSR